MPDAARKTGLSFEALCVKLIELAMDEKPVEIYCDYGETVLAKGR